MRWPPLSVVVLRASAVGVEGKEDGEARRCCAEKTLMFQHQLFGRPCSDQSLKPTGADRPRIAKCKDNILTLGISPSFKTRQKEHSSLGFVVDVGQISTLSGIDEAFVSQSERAILESP